MAIIKPFRAVRPAKNYVDMVAELPYDVMNREEAKKMGEENKYSFIHIDRAEVDLDDNVDEHDEAVYLKAKENLDKFKDEKILIKEKQECIYIYREIMDGRAQTGLVACVSVDDNINGVIKIHEYTKPDKELDRTNHIKYCNANTGTILLTYKNREKVDEIIDYYVKNVGIMVLAYQLLFIVLVIESSFFGLKAFITTVILSLLFTIINVYAIYYEIYSIEKAGVVYSCF